MTPVPSGSPSRPNLQVESDPRFPSGPWRGFSLSKLAPDKNLVELHLGFSQGVMTGEGRDVTGPFRITGKYSLEDGKCQWTNTYTNQHATAYHGYNEGKGIWGRWELLPSAQGGFYIWPTEMPDPTVTRTRTRRPLDR